MNSTLRILIATGTRADWGLLHPLAEELRQRGANVKVAATNMHLLAECGDTAREIAADGFGPDYRVPASGNPAEIASAALSGFHKLLSETKPDVLVLLGDRFEMLGAASGALLAGVPIVHIAGGTVSEGAFDDSIRHAITKMASLHLVETEKCRHRVMQMGEDPTSVVTAGALGVYNALNIPLMTKKELEESLGMELEGDVIVATLHAATLDTIPPLQQMHNLISALEEQILRNGVKVVFTYPNNDVDSALLIEAIEEFAHRHPVNVKAIPSLGRVRYLSLLRHAAAVVGNSSSGLVEVPSAGIPTLDIGIRQRGRECGASVLHCGPSREEISAGLEKILSEEMRQVASNTPNPYFKADTPSLMAEVILRHEWHPYPQKKFNPYP